MTIRPLVFVKSDWQWGPWDAWGTIYHPVRRICEPLVRDALGWTWVATGERDGKGSLLYQRVTPCQR